MDKLKDTEVELLIGGVEVLTLIIANVPFKYSFDRDKLSAVAKILLERLAEEHTNEG